MSGDLREQFSRQLNSPQRDAVSHLHGPLLVLAGAGSGKTRILTYRIIHLIESGAAFPAEIFAVTFTNKAAREMKERVVRLLEGTGIPSEDLWISTFHSSGARLLRMYGDRVGLRPGFSIFDDGDSQTLIKQCLAALDISDKVLAPKTIHHRIQAIKNEGIDPLEFSARGSDFFERRMEPLVHAYERGLRDNNAVDFGDLLRKTLELFEKNPDILDRFQDQYRFFLIDEYQDTNRVQYRLLKLLAQKYRNICVVGDEDQSIYEWRGADIRNILDFEKDYPEAKLVKLEENYRSTGNIISAANQVISHNTQRKEKKLFTSNPKGDRVEVHVLESDFDESDWVIKKIHQLLLRGEKHEEIAIFYRTHAQSRLFEDRLRAARIPYQIFGGLRFYDRAEIKNALSYLKLVVNPMDNVALSRIINVPARGIGKASLDSLAQLAQQKNTSYSTAMALLSEGEGDLNAGARKKILAFEALMRKLRQELEKLPLRDFYSWMLEETGYLASLRESEDIEAATRLENLQELASAIADYEGRVESPTLAGFLEEVALYTDQDRTQSEGASITLMTIHSAKGLEYRNVFLVGLEEELFPSIRGDAFEADPEDIEEERRLCYVGMTRARERLFVTAAHERRVFGVPKLRRLSRFVNEMPQNEIFLKDHAPSRGFSSFSKGFSRGFASTRKFEDGYDDHSYDVPGSQSNGFDEFFEKPEVTYKDDYEVGARVKHPDYGTGVIVARQGSRDTLKLSIRFADVGTKKFLAKFAPLERLS
jgi:DNA helicase-2/ATP-dependent DNA helicase PcrA